MFSSYRLNKQGRGETYRRDSRTLPELYSPWHKVNTRASLGAGSHICLRWSEPCQGFGLPTLGSSQESGLFLCFHFSSLLKRHIKVGGNFRRTLCVERCMSRNWGKEGRMYRLCHSQSTMLPCRSLELTAKMYFIFSTINAQSFLTGHSRFCSRLKDKRYKGAISYHRTLRIALWTGSWALCLFQRWFRPHELVMPSKPTQWTWVWVNSGSWLMDRETWRAVIHGVAKSRTWLRDWTELNWVLMKDFWCLLILGNGPSHHKKGL